MKKTRLEGGCACKAVRYALTDRPLIVHACHCRNCQQLTGSAFVINVWIEEDRVETRRGVPKSFRLRGGSGKGHDVFFCEACGTQVWSHYRVAPGSLFVRAGTLDDPNAVRPDVHIFTRSKVPWLRLPAEVPAFKAFYPLGKVWSADSRKRLARRRAARR